MKRHDEHILTNDVENVLPMTFNMKSLWNLAPIVVILFIMLFSAAIYYVCTAKLTSL